MPWNEIVGQPVAIRQLRNTLQRNRVGHAYLFFGPEGVGKHTTARIFAQALNCQEGAFQEACGQCRSCNLIAVGKHPDVLEVSASGVNIRIKQIQEIIRQSQFSPVEGQWKVFLINGAESMNSEAANKLLKILEEPPEKTIFILTSRATFGLLETILSRCQQVGFQALNAGGIEQVLVQRGLAEPQVARQVAQLAGGSLIGVQELLLDHHNLTREEVLKLLMRIGTEDYSRVLLLSEGWVLPSRIRILLQVLGVWFRDLMVWQKTGDIQLLVNQDCPELIKEQAKVWNSAERLLKVIQGIQRKLEQHANGQLLLEVLLLELAAYKGLSSQRQ
jgi:DNA polymerase-3 subunit delta'